MAIYIVRHGETNANVLRLIQGQTGTASLTERGRKQMQDGGHALLHRSVHAPVIIHSPSERCEVSANIIHAVVGGQLRQDRRLLQRSWGSAEGSRIDALPVRNSEDIYLGSPGKELPGDAEPIDSVLTRLRSLLDEVAPADRTTIFVSHNELLNYCIDLFLRRSLTRRHLENGEVVLLDDSMQSHKATTIHPQKRILVGQDISSESAELLRDLLRIHGFETVHGKDGWNAEDIRAIVSGVDAFGPNEAATFPNLQLVARFGTGYDNIDVEGLRNNQIRTMRLLGGSEHAVAEFTLALATLLLRDAFIDSAGLTKTPHIWHAGSRGKTLASATVGLIGFGQIGKEVGRLLSSAGSRILVWNRTWTDAHESCLSNIHATRVGTIAELFNAADLITIHLALNSETRGIIGSEAFRSALGRRVSLINVSRGNVVDESALLTSLDQGEIHSAAIDVWSTEGSKSDSTSEKLRQHARVFPSSHIAARTQDVAERQLRDLASGISAYLQRRYSELKGVELI